MYTITLARPEDLALLPAIELAAARLLVGHAPESILLETTSESAFEEAQRRGHLWVARADDRPVGFAHVEILEPGVAHLEEVDVHPAHGRRGLGRRLVLTICEWAGHAGYTSITLTTFRDLPWNMPFYARLGFEPVGPSDLTPALTAIVADEAARGMDPAHRVVMRCTVPRPQSLG